MEKEEVSQVAITANKKIFKNTKYTGDADFSATTTYAINAYTK
jgi:hypothetical protein